jgi:hypothetical protein
MSMDRRVILTVEYRRHRRAIARLRRSLADIEEALSLAEETAGDAEAALAAEIFVSGPIEYDGRRYEVERRDGIACISARPLDHALALRNRPECVP